MKKKSVLADVILYDDAGVVKLTYVSELERHVNNFSQFMIFSEKNNQKFKNFTKSNKNISST